MCDKFARTRESAIEPELAAQTRRDRRVLDAMERIDRSVAPEHREQATRSMIETMYFRRHAMARGDDRDVSGQSRGAGSKPSLRPSDTHRTRTPGKRTGQGADRSRASLDKQDRIAVGVAYLRDTVKLATMPPGTSGRAKAQNALRACAHKRGISVDTLIASFR